MPSLDRLVAFTLVATVVIVIPGPSVLFVVSRALAAGRRVAILSVVGNSLGEYVQVVAVAFGLGALAERSVAAFTTVKLVGGLYLVYLGVRAFRRRASLAVADSAGALPSPSRALAEAVTVGATNPKTIVFLAAILPQFTTPAADLRGQVLVLGLLFAAVALVSDTAWAFAADSFRCWFARSPRRAERLGGAGGLTIAALGLGLLATGRKP